MLQHLLQEIRSCTHCSVHLELGPRPVLAAHEQSKVVVIGQAPGKAVHTTGVPWDDKSGANLREWMGIESKVFYNEQQIALIPMGFCYPGKGKSGDLHPRKECAPLWHERLWSMMPQADLILLIGQYAQRQYLPENPFGNLTETVKNFRTFLPRFFVLPHPSPRNNIWRAKNPWFDREVIPELRQVVSNSLYE